jgi:hypothetical protein
MGKYAENCGNFPWTWFIVEISDKAWIKDRLLLAGNVTFLCLGSLGDFD